VPQYYLRSFIDTKDQLYVVDRPREKFFRVPTKKVGGELYFNLINVKGLDPFAVEEALAEMEGVVAPALKRIKAAKSLADENDRSAVMNLIAAVTMRNPKQRAAISEIVNQAGQHMMGAVLESKERYDQYVARMKAEEAQVKETYEEMREVAKSTPGKFRASQEFNIMIELQMHDRLVQLHEGRRWEVLAASDDSGGFVTSDHPVCLRWADGKDHGNLSPGFAVPGTEVIFPLSPQLILRGTYEGEENLMEADRKTVACTNSLIISNIHNQVYAHDALFQYKRGPKQEVGSGAHLHDDQVFLAAGKDTADAKIVVLRGI
jgi:hypothetical protein